MIARRLILPIRPRLRHFATHEVQGQAETQKQAAESIFKRGMWPLVAITIGVGFVGYHFRKNFINTGPNLPDDHKTVNDIKKEARNERDFERKLVKEVDRERDRGAERIFSKGALAKGSLESSPNATEAEKNKPFETEREAALTKPGKENKA
jgi:hypothetical protein